MKSEAVLPQSSLSMSAISLAEEVEGGVNFGKLMRTLRRKWLLIAGATVLTTAAAVVKVMSDEPIYMGSFEMLVRSQSTETEVISTIPETLTAQDSVSVNSDLLKILVSPKVLAPVVQALRTSYPEACPALTTTDVSPINLPPASSPTTVDSRATEDVAYDPCYRSLIRYLDVTASVKDSKIIVATFQDPDPIKVEVVLRLLSQAYLDYSLESKQSDIRRGIDFVEKKLPDLRQNVDDLQDQMQSLRLQYNLVDPASQGNLLSSQVGTFSQDQLSLEIELKQLRDIYNDLGQQLQGSQESDSSSALDDNPRYQSMLNKLLELDAQIADAKTTYLDASPEMQVLQEQRQNLLELLAQQGRQSRIEVARKIRELETRNQSLNQTLQGLNNDVKDLSGISRQFNDIERELQIAVENLNLFLTKREALKIDAAQREIPWEVVTPPIEPQPLIVSLPQNILLGFLLGLVLGTGAALLLDKATGVIYSDEEIRRLTRLPVLGRIPLNKVGHILETSLEHSLDNRFYDHESMLNASSNGSNTRLVVDEKQVTSSYVKDPFSESFRSLYTNLRLLNSTKPIRALVVSSVMEGEGKSTVAIHLAEAAAAMGKRVLLIDADLRKPQIHHYLELSNERGLTNLFSGEANLDIIQKFSPVPNLYVISAGSLALEPSRLFSSRSMKLFADQIKNKFELVIYDTPPLVGQSDAYLVADNADGLLLVTQPGKIKQELLDRAMEQLTIADINVLGLVVREN
jgi:polysaccharide biosynthesis transport protein